MREGYKLSEVGVIPEDWEVWPFTEVTTLITCGIAATPEYVAESRGYPFLSSSNVKEGRIVWSGYKHISADLHRQLYRNNPPKKGDILYSRVGTFGEAAVVDVDFEFSVYVSLTLIKPGKPLDSFFLMQLLNSDAYKRRAKDQIYLGGGVGNLNVDVVRRYPIVVPPLPEQRAIAEALSDVDGLLGGLDRLIAKKRDLKQAAMQQLLTGQTRLPGFHGEWEVKTFGEVVVPRRERIDPRRTGVLDFCIELEHIESGSGQILGSTSTGIQSSLKSVFHPGDVLFGKLRAYLRKYWRATRSGVCSTEIWVLVPRDAAITSEFLFQIIQTDDFIDVASNSYGTHMPRSDWNIVQNHELKMPPLPEQTAIAKVLTDMDAELAKLTQRRDKTRALKQAMMQELLTGRTRLVAPGGKRIE